jgi:hypothetical protein
MQGLQATSLPPPARSCDRMLGVPAHAPHDPSRTSARGSCGRDRRSSLRPSSTHTPAMPSDASGCWPCLHPPCVYSCAHRPAHYSAHGHIQRRAYMRALAHVCTRNVAYTHSTSLTRHTCACMRTCTCTQPDRPIHTHRRDVTGKTHPGTHMHTRTHTRTHTQWSTYIHTCTHMNTHRHTKEHARAHTYTQTFICMCDTHMHTHKRTCAHTPTHTQTFVYMCDKHMHTHATHVLTHS